MTLAENLVHGNERGSSPTNMTQAHGEGARHVGAADAGLKVVCKITCLGSGFVGGELTLLPYMLQLTAN